ncbi:MULTISPECIES: SLATT domain-containing protein [Enterobacterales]|uniref:SLATT domain-containing protein n=2 Tax=Enterobacterales TaxID=91347 RepID=A0A4Q9EIG3_9GAMM|nr:MULTISPECIES: SLATT domain-containing protein [Enterobacterales]MDK9365163.1 SLATT domain-containing protein [Lelliottia sp. V106_12]MDK9617860.1 SLATT domain-containing protein [Lelliottia sp. V106_9]TBM24583.1 SLATT domain-containing protein [Hafnia paralvei]
MINGKDDFTVPELICVLNSWLKRCKDARDGHYKRAETLFDRSQILGYMLIYSTVFVTVFSFFSSTSTLIAFWGITKQHVVVLMGCISAVISGVVTQARYGERAEIHRSSGARYANLARKIEVLQLKINAGLIEDGNIEIQSSEIVEEWNNLSEDSLLTPHNESRSKLMLHGGIALIFAFLFFSVAHS